MKCLLDSLSEELFSFHGLTASVSFSYVQNTGLQQVYGYSPLKLYPHENL